MALNYYMKLRRYSFDNRILKRKDISNEARLYFKLN